MSAFAIVAPSDAQLRYIVTLCERRNFPRPRAVHSFQEAGEIIDAIKAGTYDPEQYVPDANLPWALRPS